MKPLIFYGCYYKKVKEKNCNLKKLIRPELCVSDNWLKIVQINWLLYLWERSLTTSFHCGIWTARSARVRHSC